MTKVFFVSSHHTIFGCCWQGTMCWGKVYLQSGKSAVNCVSSVTFCLIKLAMISRTLLTLSCLSQYLLKSCAFGQPFRICCRDWCSSLQREQLLTFFLPHRWRFLLIGSESRAAFRANFIVSCGSRPRLSDRPQGSCLYFKLPRHLSLFWKRWLANVLQTYLQDLPGSFTQTCWTTTAGLNFFLSLVASSCRCFSAMWRTQGSRDVSNSAFRDL